MSVICYGDDVGSHAYPYPVTPVSRRRSIPVRLARYTAEILRQGRDADLLFVSNYGLPAAVAQVGLRKPMVLKLVHNEFRDGTKGGVSRRRRIMV